MPTGSFALPESCRKSAQLPHHGSECFTQPTNVCLCLLSHREGKWVLSNYSCQTGCILLPHSHQDGL